MKRAQRSTSVVEGLRANEPVAAPSLRLTALAAALAAMGMSGEAGAGSLDFGSNTSMQYTVTLNYALGLRLSDPNNALTNGPVSAATGLPATVNADDGDRNFRSGSLINNRISARLEADLRHDNYGVFVRGDGFYDQAYHHPNDNDSPSTVNKAGPNTRFSDDARYFQGNRARLLDAYAYGEWRLAGSDLNVRFGRQVVGWGESLFFPNIAGAQGPADATRANVPGTEVKDILLPVNQAMATLAVSRDLTLLGYYQLQYRPTELDPVGDYFSYTDVVGPGAEFIRAFAVAPGVSYNIPSTGEHRPSDFGQYGLGLRYNLGVTELGFYQLRYHDKNPSVFTNYGLVGGTPLPVSYDIRYVDGIDLTGVSLSSSIGPVNVAGEVSYKNGVPLLVNTLAGPAAMPGKATQAQASAIYIVGPSVLAREIDLVGEVGYLHVNGVEGASTDSLSNSRNAWAYEGTATFNYPNVFNGWDLAVPLSWAHAVTGNAAVAGAFGSLVGHGDQRASVGLTFTYLSRLEVATSYNAFLGSANPVTHPLADRDYVALNLKYRF
ncbi:MAG TPA: DUF1302 family protein [Nevskia sp.]|nr:DUF1302 family protein [Nevskia sp.]